MADEWFRSPCWGPDDRADFEQRLARARAKNRGQYLRIKGLALKQAGHVDGARSLWLRVVEDPGYEIQRWSALEHVDGAPKLVAFGADLAFDTDPHEAERLYRQLLVEDPTLNATTQMAEVRLAELLTREGSASSLREAEEFLETWRADRHTPFPVDHFRWELARARWGEATGRADVTHHAARQAIALAGRGSPFPRHPDAGVVHPDPKIMSWLRARAGA